MSAEYPELLDAFRAAALSVTKLYKTSAAAQAKARVDGYQDCLEDLMAFVDKEGLAEGEGSRVRKWIAERMDGRDATAPGTESDDDGDKGYRTPTPDIHRSGDVTRSARPQPEAMLSDTLVAPDASEQQSSYEIVVPSQDTFAFRSSHPYPAETYIDLGKLNLSDTGRAHDTTSRPTLQQNMHRSGRQRNGNRPGPRANLGRGAGQKRKAVNLAEYFDLGSLGNGNGKDMFGGGKRSRHA